MKQHRKFLAVIVRTLLLLITLSLSVSGLVLPSFATTPAEETYATFTFDERKVTITADFPANEKLDEAVTKTYFSYSGGQWHHIMATTTERGIHYNRTIRIDGTTYQIYGEKYAGDYLVLEHDENYTILFTQEGLTKANDLVRNQNFDNYKVLFRDQSGDMCYATMKKSLYQDLQRLPKDSGVSMTISLKELKYATHNTIVGYAESVGSWVGVRTGVVFNLNHVFYYLPYDAIPSHAFYKTTGEIDFSRDVEVKLYQLVGDLQKEYNDTTLRYDRNGVRFTDEEDLSRGFSTGMFTSENFIALMVIFCVLPSLAPIIVGLCKYFAGRRKGRRRWLFLIGMGAVWLICSLFIVVLIGVAV